MNTRHLLPAVAACLLIAGCQTHAPQPREFVVSLTSAVSVSFTGHLTVDGKDQAISGNTPAVYKIVAHNVAVHMNQGPENGLLTAEVRVGPHTDAPVFVTASDGPNTSGHGTTKPHGGWYW